MSDFRSIQGRRRFEKGAMAEQQVAEAYRRNGFTILDRRYRTRDGEIDLIAHHGDRYYFVEVKSSATHDRAAEMITPAQQRRIHRAALRYLCEKARTIDVDCRFDAALVDRCGRLKVLPGALTFD